MAEKKWDVYVYGDVNIDIVIEGVDRLPAPGQEELVGSMDTFVGGGAALFTLGLGKLGLHPVFQGKVGDDFFGTLLREQMEALHVDTSLLEMDKTGKTGISLSFTDELDRSFLTYRGTNQEISMDKVDIDKVKQARHIHVTGYEGEACHDAYEALLKRVKSETDATVSFDLGWDVTGTWSKRIYELMPMIDILFMNETEAIHYGHADTAEAAAMDFAARCGQAVIKLGSKGALAVADGKLYRQPPYQVKAVDTTGAGDSFNAGYVYGFLRGLDIGGCLKTGNGCGALSVTALGGNTGFPDEKRLKEFIGEKEEG